MSTTVLNTKIKLRKDTADNFAKVATTLVPLDGEVCVVDTGSTGIRLKVGDGVKNFGALSYIDLDVEFKQPVVIGYYYEGKFYDGAAKTRQIPTYSHQLYIDYISNVMYYYNGTALCKAEGNLPTASASQAGVMYLYAEQGQNTNGTVTQKLFTDAINAIEFDMDESETECLILKKPWATE